MGFPDGSAMKNLPANSRGEAGSMPGLGRSPRESNGNLLQYSCLENPMDRGAHTAHRVATSQIQLSSMQAVSNLLRKGKKKKKPSQVSSSP